MLDRLAKIEERFMEIEKNLCDPDVISDRERYTRLSRERAEMEELIPVYREYR